MPYQSYLAVGSPSSTASTKGGSPPDDMARKVLDRKWYLENERRELMAVQLDMDIDDMTLNGGLSTRRNDGT